MSVRHNNFKKLAEERMTRIFQTANLISNLSTITRYTYTKEEIEEMFSDCFEKGEEIRGLFYIEESDYTPFNKNWDFFFSTPGLENDVKNDNFRKLAAQRLNNIYKNLQLISNLRNKKIIPIRLKRLTCCFQHM